MSSSMQNTSFTELRIHLCRVPDMIHSILSKSMFLYCSQDTYSLDFTVPLAITLPVLVLGIGGLVLYDLRKKKLEEARA